MGYGNRLDRRRLWGRNWGLVRSVPIVLYNSLPKPALDVDLLTVVCCVTSLTRHLSITACSCDIGIRRTDIFNSWSLYIPVLGVVCLHHGNLGHRGCYARGQWRGLNVGEVRVIGVDDVAVQLQLSMSKCLGCGSLSCSCCAGSFLTCSIFFCEALLPRFCFPVIVSNASAVFYNTATELSEHRPCGDQGYLA